MNYQMISQIVGILLPLAEFPQMSVAGWFTRAKILNTLFCLPVGPRGNLIYVWALYTFWALPSMPGCSLRLPRQVSYLPLSFPCGWVSRIFLGHPFFLVNLNCHELTFTSDPQIVMFILSNHLATHRICCEAERRVKGNDLNMMVLKYTIYFSACFGFGA